MQKRKKFKYFIDNRARFLYSLAAMKRYSHWFFINSERLEIYTYGLGNHPTNTHRFEDKEIFQAKIKALTSDGFEFIKDQAKS
jgi:hypothetical protein